jgi:hypothetical protein
MRRVEGALSHTGEMLGEGKSRIREEEEGNEYRR